MKTCFRVVCIGVSLLCTIFGSSQLAGQSIGDGVFDQAGIQPALADLNVGWPGRVWVQVNIAEEGLGYEGSYFTLGAKQHIFQDFLDGRWLLETRGHFDTESDSFFGNLGIERVISINSAGAEVSTGFWVDYDDSQQSDFADSLTALGVSASIETHRWALFGNGYFPIGDSDFSQGNPLQNECFLDHSIVTVAGIESALEGFDALLQFKPHALANVNGTIGLGGYQYSSDLVESFGGVRARVGGQLRGGAVVTVEVNHDDRFDFTGALQVGWVFGAGARGTEYGLLGNDLDSTVRNDHVVRFQQDVQLAIDPDTGLPYDVFHVDNLAAPGGDGTVENPFDNLAAAEAASGPDDIIFVNEGGGTTRNMDQGIVLQDGQLLLGDGVQHLIPLADGTNFILCNDIDGNLPTITNVGLGDAITLANRNTVRGFIIDGSDGGLVNGISGNAGFTLNDGIIEDVTITGSPILNGIFLNDIAGDWSFNRNNIQSAFLDGINIQNTSDPLGTFTFQDNIVSANGRDGIHIDDFDAVAITFIDNETDDNGRDGIRIENHRDSLGIGTNINFIDTEFAAVVPNGTDPTAQGNIGNGISLTNVSGDFNFLNMEIRDNLNAGISLVNVTTPGADQGVFIGTFAGGTSIFDGNGAGTGAGVFNDLGVPGGQQQLFITDTTFQNGGTGIVSQATATAANLQTDIIDNNGILNHAADGIQLNASGGATHTAVVTNNMANLNITNSGGNGITVNASGIGPVSSVDATISNVVITNSGAAGIRANVVENGQAIVQASATTIMGAVDGIQITADNLASTGVSQFNFDGLTINTVGDDGVDIDVFDQTFVDFSITGSTITNANVGDHGIEINADGDAALTEDTRLRFQAIGNTITGFDAGDGIGLLGTGDSQIIAILDGNTITGNGINQAAVGAPTLPFGDGVDITAIGDSEIFTRIVNNTINGNAEQGLDLNTAGNGSIAAFVVGNNLAGNDISDDPATVPIESGIADMTAINAATGNICIAMSNNFFNLPAIFANAGGPADFLVELDGVTNGDGIPTFLPAAGAFGMGTFSTVCEPTIATEEAVFAANGFPPLP